MCADEGVGDGFDGGYQNNGGADKLFANHHCGVDGLCKSSSGKGSLGEIGKGLLRQREADGTRVVVKLNSYIAEVESHSNDLTASKMFDPKQGKIHERQAPEYVLSLAGVGVVISQKKMRRSNSRTDRLSWTRESMSLQTLDRNTNNIFCGIVRLVRIRSGHHNLKPGDPDKGCILRRSALLND
jgi:hypothetical protein